MGDGVASVPVEVRVIGILTTVSLFFFVSGAQNARTFSNSVFLERFWSLAGAGYGVATVQVEVLNLAIRTCAPLTCFCFLKQETPATCFTCLFGVSWARVSLRIESQAFQLKSWGLTCTCKLQLIVLMLLKQGKLATFQKAFFLRNMPVAAVAQFFLKG